MSTKSPVSLRLDLGASRLLAAVLMAAHGGAAAIAAWLPLALPFRLGLLALVAVSLYRGLRDHALRRGARAITAFRLNADDTCAVQRGAAGWEEGRLRDCWVHPLLTILVVRAGGRRRSVSVVIAADAVSAEAFRRLRVRLRLQTAAG